MRIDAHQHFWVMERGDYSWLTPELAAIYRDFQPEDLTPLLKQHSIDGTVLVQAAATVSETEYMLNLADQHSFILGVVGWVDFESSDVAEVINRLTGHPKFVGLRPMIQDIDDTDWMLRSGLQPAFDAIVAEDLTFDALTLPRHLSNLLSLLQRNPEMRVVVDHGSKPNIREAEFDDWAAGMGRLARETTAFCKLSGLATQAGPGWKIDDLRKYSDFLLQSFGPERLIWGSDWPVCTLAASYGAWVEATNQLLTGLSEDEKQAIMGKNAQRVYKLSPKHQ